MKIHRGLLAAMLRRTVRRMMSALTACVVGATALLVGCGHEGRVLEPGASNRPTAFFPNASSFDLVSTIAFTSTRDDPTNPTPFNAAEIYLIDGDGGHPRRLTNNTSGDGFAALSPDGKKIVFNSNRLRTPDEPTNTSDLFVMDSDGSGETHLIRGSSASWSADSKNIAFHASASGTGLPIKPDPGAATFDSDIFVANVDELLGGSAARRNLTNTTDAIEDDPDWSPDGQKIAYTSHLVSDNQLNSVTAEVYVINADGSGTPQRLTNNVEEERAPSWSPDGSRIVYMCRHGGPDFEICVMNADGTGQTQITDNGVLDATPSWSPDGTKICFHRQIGAQFQLWTMNPDGTGQTQLTFPPGINLFANWGELRAHISSDQTANAEQ
jgi:Tol biopolymer transport system component